jgi:hypothetical protein
MLVVPSALGSVNYLARRRDVTVNAVVWQLIGTWS